MTSFFKKITLAFVLTFLFSCSDQEMDSTIKSDSQINTQVASRFAVGTTTVDEFGFKTIDAIKNFTFITSNNNATELLDSKVKYAVKSYRITYKTVDYNGAVIDASGSLLIPQKNSASEVFPVLSMQHGTMFSDDEVKGNSLGDYPYYSASTGFIVVVPDYIGYESSSNIQHPYFINKCSDRAVKDMLISSMDVIDSLGINHNGKLFLYGFSEGANVTVSFLKSIEENPIPNLTIAATSACSGAYSLKDQFKALIGNNSGLLYNSSDLNTYKTIFAIYASYMIYGFDKTIAKTNAYNLVFNPPYLQQVNNGLFGGNYDTSQVGLTFGQYAPYQSNFFTNYFLSSINSETNYWFIKYLNDNSLVNLKWSPKSKIILMHGTSDIISYKNTTKLKQMFDQYSTNNSSNIELLPISGLNHDEQILFPLSILWINANK